MPLHVEIQLLAVVVAAACALPGVFLVLRRVALISDAISHSVLLGIVLAFFWVRDLTHPALILGATATGILTVALVEALHRSGRVKEDAAIALVFPALFSLAVLLIARYAGQIHLDVHSVLLGEIALSPFRRWEVGGVDLGPRSLWMMGGILILNAGALLLLWKELKVSTFDPALAASLGFSPVVLHYAFMTLVSVTAVGAFDAVGSILVVALMIAPPATAWLLTDRLSVMVGLSVALAVAAAVTGFWAAWLLDVSIAGSMAAMTGVGFVLAFILAPDRGVLASLRRRARQRVEFSGMLLAVHLLHHEGTADESVETRVDHLQKHLRWSPDFARRVIDRAERVGWVRREGRERLRLTPLGRETAKVGMIR
ncbi:MAG: metal ABC transporter permease [Gemmatimonadales bacterium]|nr:MAG: metal ABC transporter permease [Gemmatimonadales bacterium]